MLSLATSNLKKGIEYAVHQIRSKKVDPDTKLRWMRALSKQAETLVKIAEARRNIESKSNNMDIATYLSQIENRIPPEIRKESRTLRRATIDAFRTVRRTTGQQYRVCHH